MAAGSWAKTRPPAKRNSIAEMKSTMKMREDFIARFSLLFDCCNESFTAP
jgi:hypothetical protein